MSYHYDASNHRPDLNSTSAQLGYTVSFTSVYTGKCERRHESKTNTLQKLNTTKKKHTMQNTAK